MPFDYLLCPSCRCPLNPESGSAIGTACPRCNTWVELDPLCNGGCVSCFKTKAASGSMTSCTAEDGSVPVSIGRAADSATLAGPAPTNDPGSRAQNSWKELFRKIFVVR